MTLSGGTNNANVPSNSSNSYSSLNAQLAATATSTNGQITFMCAGVLSNLQVTASVLPGSGNSWDINVRTDENDSDLECTVTNSGLTCTSAATLFNYVSPGDAINIEIDPNDGPIVANFDWSVDVDPPSPVYP